MEKRISERNFRQPGYHVFKGPENCSGSKTEKPLTRKPVENVLTCFSKRANISRENSVIFSPRFMGTRGLPKSFMEGR